MKDKERVFEQRLRDFALWCAKLTRMLPQTEQNKEYGKQLIRSSASVGANYAEAICAFTRKDFAYDINMCRKEAKESHYWLELLSEANSMLTKHTSPILNEAHELVKIFQKSATTLRENKNRK